MVVREEPTFLTLVCLAQSRWIRFLGGLCTYNQGSVVVSALAVHTMARKSTGNLLVVIGKQVQVGCCDGNDERIAGAFDAGINPLLAQLTDFPEAASVEIARAGLAAILPLVGWSGTALEVQLAQVSALTGLISLMNGSYPIMPYHGKKIMTDSFFYWIDLTKMPHTCVITRQMILSVGGGSTIMKSQLMLQSKWHFTLLLLLLLYVGIVQKSYWTTSNPLSPQRGE